MVFTMDGHFIYLVTSAVTRYLPGNMYLPSNYLVTLPGNFDLPGNFLPGNLDFDYVLGWDPVLPRNDVVDV